MSQGQNDIRNSNDNVNATTGNAVSENPAPKEGDDQKRRTIDTPTEPVARANTSGTDDRKARRERLRNKFDEYLKNSKAEDNNGKYKDALEKLKQEEDAKGFNLVCRTKGDQMSGLIILNRLSGSKPKQTLPPTTEVEAAPPKTIKQVAPPVEEEEMESHKEEEEESSENLEIEPDEEASIPMVKPTTRKASRAKKVAVTERKPRRQSTSRKDNNEVLIKGLSNKVDSLWRKLDDMKTKKKNKKLHKQAKAALKAELFSDYEKPRPQSAKQVFYNKLDSMTTGFTNDQQTNSGYIFKNLY